MLLNIFGYFLFCLGESLGWLGVLLWCGDVVDVGFGDRCDGRMCGWCEWYMKFFKEENCVWLVVDLMEKRCG